MVGSHEIGNYKVLQHKVIRFSNTQQKIQKGEKTIRNIWKLEIVWNLMRCKWKLLTAFNLSLFLSLQVTFYPAYALLANWIRIRWVCFCCGRFAFISCSVRYFWWLVSHRYSIFERWWKAMENAPTNSNVWWFASVFSVASFFYRRSDFWDAYSTNITISMRGCCNGIRICASSFRYHAHSTVDIMSMKRDPCLWCSWSNTYAQCWSALHRRCGCIRGKRLWAGGDLLNAFKAPAMPIIWMVWAMEPIWVHSAMGSH